MAATVKLLVMSDIHGCFRDFPPDKMPDVDVVLVAGDVTNLGIRDYGEVARAEDWFKALGNRYPVVFYVLGNHDIGLYQGYFDDSARNEVYDITDDIYPLESAVFVGASLSPCFNIPKLAEHWVRMTANKGVDAEYFSTLPPADIVVSHCPPYGYCDATESGEHIGSPGLLSYIERHKPRLVVCGHVHEAAGDAMIGDTCVLNVAQQWKLIDLENS